MNDLELIDALRTTSRVDDATIATVTDRHALSALREGITMTDRHTTPGVETPRRGRRLGRRGMAAGALGLVLAGGGTAWAVAQLDRGPTLDGLNCAESMTLRPDGDVELERSADGRAASGDDVADCAVIRQSAGMPPLADPTAFVFHGTHFVVAGAGVPAGVLESATPSVPDPERAAMLELEAALGDWVEGPSRLCLTTSQAQQYAEDALRQVGLSGWTTRVSTPPTTPESGPCAGLTARPDLKRVEVEAEARKPVQPPSDAVALQVYTTAEALEKQVAGQCLPLAEATRIATQLVGDQGQVSPVPDEAASCTRVDMEVGGSLFVTIHGPAVAKP
jgi:hypothetical protein